MPNNVHRQLSHALHLFFFDCGCEEFEFLLAPRGRGKDKKCLRCAPFSKEIMAFLAIRIAS